MAASTNAGDARRASLGVARALSRVIVLGGLVIGGWLLGSGIGLASEAPGSSGAGPSQSDSGSGGQLGAPPTLTSAVTTARSVVSLPARPVQPPAKLGIVQPIVNALDAPTPLVTLPEPAKYRAGSRSQAPAEEAVTAPPAQPAISAATATAPVPTRGATTVLTTVSHAAPTHPAAVPATHLFSRQLALGEDPTAPVPASPPATTTSPCMTGGTGGGAGTKNIPDLAVNGSWAKTMLASTQHLLCLPTNDLPRSPAAQPTTSPD